MDTIVILIKSLLTDLKMSETYGIQLNNLTFECSGLPMKFKVSEGTHNTFINTVLKSIIFFLAFRRVTCITYAEGDRIFSSSLPWMMAT